MLSAVVVLFLVAAPAPVPPDVSDILLHDLIRASGIEDPREMEAAVDRLRRVEQAVRDEIGSSRDPIRVARNIHRELHDRLLLRYRASADGLDGVLQRGEYNCVSAVLLYAWLAHGLGIEAQVVESPGHLFLRIPTGADPVDIETTSPRGFDLRHRYRRFRKFALAYKYATAEDFDSRGAASLYDEYLGVASVVEPRAAVGYLWRNRAVRALEVGDNVAAARFFHEAHRTHPTAVEGDPDVRSALARSFLVEYDVGRFESALAIARYELAIFPGRTSATDRLQAAGRKWVEQAIDLDDPAEAARRLDRIVVDARVDRARRRLERDLYPVVAVAAARAGDWVLAERAVERFRDAEPDRIEVGRLESWVRSRRSAVFASDFTIRGGGVLEVHTGVRAQKRDAAASVP